MGIRELGRRLGISPSLVSRLVRRGMPFDSEESARSWRAQYVKARKEVGPPPVVPIELHQVSDAGKNGVENLEATLERLREQERTIAMALQTLLKEGRLSEAAALRREHVGTVKALFDAESRALKINQARGKLISLDQALRLISQSFSEPLILLRPLPELAKDAEQKRALESFLAAVLNAIQDGAQESLRERKAG